MTTRGAERPNIVVVVADDHGREAVGCYGNPVVSTPTIDRLAAEGLRFENAFCTTASCSASRSVILTGLHAHTNRTYGLVHEPHHFSMSDHVRTLPALMRRAGYRTGRMGKKHYRPEHLFPFDMDPPEWGSDEDILRHRDDRWFADRCAEFVAGGSPFFLYWCSHDPHRDRPRRAHPLRPDSFGNPDEPFPGDVDQHFDPAEVVVPPFLADLPEVRAELAEYYRAIARLDRGVGRLLEHLEAAGVLDDTVVVYLSDNGAAFPLAKTTLYEPGMALPLIIRDPRRPHAGATTSALVTWADLAPTVLDLAGAPELAEPMFGDSLVPLLDHPGDPGRDHVFASHSLHEVTGYYPMRVVRTRRWKLIHNIAWKLDHPTAADLHASATWQATLREGAALGSRSVDSYLHRPRFELYDLEADPLELHDRAADPEQSGRVEEMVGLIRGFQAETRDPWLHKWSYE